MKKYKIKYESHFGLVPFGFTIHHIDINRKNNDIKNLVAIPETIHDEYHLNEKYMIWCFKQKNYVGFKYHRDRLIFLFKIIMSYKKSETTI